MSGLIRRGVEFLSGKRIRVPIDEFDDGGPGGERLKKNFGLEFTPGGKVEVIVTHENGQTYEEIVTESLKPRKLSVRRCLLGW